MVDQGKLVMLKRTISELLLDQVKKSADKNAIGWVKNKKLKTINFKAYKETIETLTLALLNLGLEKQDKVCILSNTQKEWHYTDMAILCSGAISVPIYPNYTQDETLYIINHSEAEFLVLENKHQFEKFVAIADKIKNIKKIILLEDTLSDSQKDLADRFKIINYDELFSIGRKDLVANPDKFDFTTKEIQEEDIATVVYTSGTTGCPKGAVISQKALAQVLLNLKKFSRNAFSSNDSFLTFLPLAHVLGRCESFLPITFGCSCVYASSLDNILDEMQIAKPTMLIGVPRFFEKIYEGTLTIIEDNPIKVNLLAWANNVANKYFDIMNADKAPNMKLILEYQLAKKLVFEKVYAAFGGRVRFFISGGAPLDIEIIKFLRNSNLTLLEGYGLTETIAPCCLNPLNKQMPGTVGQPIGDVEIKIADDTEILLKSEALFTEYFKDPSSTAEVFNDDGWFLTGDMGEINSEGFLKIIGRKKNLIITSGGKNIAPGKIEVLLLNSKYISAPIIVGDNRKHLVALIGLNIEAMREEFADLEIKDGAVISELCSNPAIRELIQKEIDLVNEELASFETIKQFEILPIIVHENNYLTPSLKIKRKLIEKDFKNLIDAMYN